VAVLLAALVLTACDTGATSEPPPGLAESPEATGAAPGGASGTAGTPGDAAEDGDGMDDAVAGAPRTPTAIGTVAPAPTPPAPGTFGFGRPPDETLLAAWDIDVLPDGSGLPPGSGTHAEGESVYATRCVACHAEGGEGTPLGPQLVSAPGPYEVGMPRTIGSWWPYAPTVWDYINRAMPFDQPGSLTADEVYAVTAYLLAENGVIDEDEAMDPESLSQVEMPSEPIFYPCWPDPCRPDF